MKHLTDVECQAAHELAKKLASSYVQQRLGGNLHPQVVWTMKNSALTCSLRASNNGAVWLNATTPYTKHNCVSSKSSARPGVVVQSRYDSTDFVGWITEEIEEALIRVEIISRVNAAQHDNLLHMLVKRSERKAKAGIQDPLCANIMTGVTFLPMV